MNESLMEFVKIVGRLIFIAYSFVFIKGVIKEAKAQTQRDREEHRKRMENSEKELYQLRVMNLQMEVMQLIYSDKYLDSREKQRLLRSLDELVNSARTLDDFKMIYVELKSRKQSIQFHIDVNKAKEEFRGYSTYSNMDWKNNNNYQKPPTNTPEVVKYLKVLNLDSGITNFAIIKKRYRDLLKTNHPDISRNPKAEEITKIINEAYDYLEKVFG